MQLQLLTQMCGVVYLVGLSCIIYFASSLFACGVRSTEFLAFSGLVSDCKLYYKTKFAHEISMMNSEIILDESNLCIASYCSRVCMYVSASTHTMNCSTVRLGRLRQILWFL